MTRKYIGAKLLLKQLNWILKGESLTIDGIDEIKVKIRLRVWNDREYNTKGMNGEKMDMNDRRKPEGRPRNKNNSLDKIEKNTEDQKESSRELGIG
jgi:hypothetical protein